MAFLDVVSLISADEALELVKKYNVEETFGYPTYEEYRESTTFKIVENDKMVGFVAVYLRESEKVFSVNVWSLFIFPEFRKRGYAKDAISCLLKIFKHKIHKNKLLYIYGFVDKNNKIALSFYKKNYNFLSRNRKDVGQFHNIIPLECDNGYEVVFYKE